MTDKATAALYAATGALTIAAGIARYLNEKAEQVKPPVR